MLRQPRGGNDRPTSEQDFEVRLEYVQSVKKNKIRLESPLDFVSSISRPQERDQTLKYNEKYFGLFLNFFDFS